MILPSQALTSLLAFRKFIALLLVAALTVTILGVGTTTAVGYLDTSFGNAGKITTSVNGNQETLRQVMVQMDGKIIAAGSDNNGDVYLARYNNDGSLDNTFGATGWIKTTDRFFGGLALQSDGKILIGNQTFGTTVTRYNSNGTLDATFGTGGRASGPSAGARDLAVQPDGKIVLGGATGDQDFAVVRFNANGTVDTQFGIAGRVTTNVVGFDFVTGVTVQSDGKIVASGVGSGPTLASSNFATVRYNSNGSLDSSFGMNGIVVTDFFNSFDMPNDVAIQNDGRIVVVGVAGRSAVDASQDDFAIVRYNSNGTPDSTFGNTGKVTSDFSAGSSDNARGVAPQPDGKIVVAGGSFFGSWDFLVARYNANGTLDSSFGDGGRVNTDFGNGDMCYGVAIQPDGKIVAVGQATIDTGTVDIDFALARYYETGQSAPPRLLVDHSSSRAVAIDSVTFVRDPFTLITSSNFSGDPHTRLALLATSADLLPGDTLSAVTAQAEDSAHLIHPLTVEFVGKVQNNFWFTQIVVRLPDSLVHAGDVQLSITVRGVSSNKVTVRIN